MNVLLPLSPPSGRIGAAEYWPDEEDLMTIRGVTVQKRDSTRPGAHQIRPWITIGSPPTGVGRTGRRR